MAIQPAAGEFRRRVTLSRWRQGRFAQDQVLKKPCWRRSVHAAPEPTCESGDDGPGLGMIRPRHWASPSAMQSRPAQCSEFEILRQGSSPGRRCGGGALEPVLHDIKSW